ncbi:MULTISPECIES: EI24 domain-containing protein [unclassified Campylobacter]|uniref:EI24 domain-containing protein n=1 Tax=unclassified Campylobacter TaxID=2593542 RepID=UPI0022E9B51C|nr:MULTISPECIES: EI24 domain-containing protein [unclassified Campylobacter]MDA3048616.1 EI24 domain-containing protein [Campylobacter sp. JMF_08 NE1]MDA3055152.1 EI24 domain-containing protein [Campylobacter sp. VBCF_07 NA4]MDA3061404.1 EI24 domain-containing protein [Campylobacter sp. VBCF_02 NA5]MDA3070921.1 EI24 domain-containing protein [Campylobacter sp. VBCF_08 NA3]MDA3078817.1 EI24 domain-containing protein [Campylobacter sp. JMF_06 NA1]
MGKIFRLSIKDFFTKKFITLSLLPFFCALLVLGYFMYFGGSEIFALLEEGAKSGDFSFLDEARFPLIAKLLAYGATKWIIGVIFYTFGTFLVLMLSVFCALFIAGFLTPIVTKEINLRHYHLERADEPNLGRVLTLMAIEILKFIGILLLCLLLLAVPLINLFVINIPFFYIYYKLILIDVASNTLDKKSFEKCYKKGGGYKFMLSVFLFYLACLIPLVGLFFQLFFIIYLSHIIFLSQLKFKKINANQ